MQHAQGSVLLTLTMELNITGNKLTFETKNIRKTAHVHSGIYLINLTGLCDTQ